MASQSAPGHGCQRQCLQCSQELPPVPPSSGVADVADKLCCTAVILQQSEVCNALLDWAQLLRTTARPAARCHRQAVECAALSTIHTCLGALGLGLVAVARRFALACRKADGCGLTWELLQQLARQLQL